MVPEKRKNVPEMVTEKITPSKTSIETKRQKKNIVIVKHENGKYAKGENKTKMCHIFIINRSIIIWIVKNK